MLGVGAGVGAGAGAVPVTLMLASANTPLIAEVAQLLVRYITKVSPVDGIQGALSEPEPVVQANCAAASVGDATHTWTVCPAAAVHDIVLAHVDAPEEMLQGLGRAERVGVGVVAEEIVSTAFAGYVRPSGRVTVYVSVVT